MGKRYIEFDNLVQADSVVAGKIGPVKAEKEDKANPRGYVQKNAVGELYRPTGIEDVRARAKSAGKSFKKLFPR